MMDEQRISELIEKILETQCPLEEACATCPELLTEVRKRVEAVRRVEQQIEMLFPALNWAESGTVTTPAKPSAEGLPQVAGYDVQSILGRGGMGVVYKAKHLKLNRTVALKMLLSGPYASPHELARFRRESQAVAALEHPHIVQVHDAGELDGRPYFTMEFVEGGSLSEQLAGVPQEAHRSAKLVRALAGAVQLAHQQGIIHRDLKPANILLTSDGTPKIADFGLAWQADSGPDLTVVGARIGTPSYMAPEQAMGKRGALGPSVDIYALGAILYEMLTGRAPFRADTAMETERQVLLTDPVMPSRLNANIPRDLETICLKCLHKDPARRYLSAAKLAEDLDRFMAGQPVLARPVGWTELVWRWGMRNRTVAVALASIGILLVVLIAGSIWAAAHFRELDLKHHQLALKNGRLAEQKGVLLLEKERQRENAVAHRRLAEGRGKSLRQNLYFTEMNLAGQASSFAGGLGPVRERLVRWDQERPDIRGWEWYYLHGLCHRSLLTLSGHFQGVYNVAISPDGLHVASAGMDRSICIWNLADEQLPKRLLGHEREVNAVAWSPDGTRLASASWDHTVRIWDVATSSQIASLAGHSAEVFSVAWNPDGSLLASGGADGLIHIWDIAQRTSRSHFQGHDLPVASVAWSPDGERLASGGRDSVVQIWDVVSGKSLHRINGHINWVQQVVFSPDGSRLASASNDETLKIWNPENGQELLTFKGHIRGVTGVAWSPDGHRLVTCSEDQTLKVWPANGGAAVFTMRGHTGPVTSVLWSAAGNRFFSAAYDGTVKVWDASAGPETPVLHCHHESLEALAWCPGTPHLCASAGLNGMIQVWDMNTRTVHWAGRRDESPIRSLAWHPAANRLATASDAGKIQIWDVGQDSDPIELTGHVGPIYSVSWHPNGRWLASGGHDHTVRVWDVVSGECKQSRDQHAHAVYSAAWSPDGRRLATASEDRTVKIWDAENVSELLCYRGQTTQVLTLAWSPDSTTIASAGYDKVVRFWDAATGQSRRILQGHTSNIAHMQWSPDGNRMASVGNDFTKVWDTATGKETLSLPNEGRRNQAVGWSPDGMKLATGSEDGLIRIYDATSGYRAARSTQLLPQLDQSISAQPTQPTAWRIRGEVHARNQQWKLAAEDMRRSLLLKSDPPWSILDGQVSGPYVSDLKVLCAPEKESLFDPLPSAEEDVSRRAIWRALPESSQGNINFGELFERQENISAYIVFPIYSLDTQDVALLLGTDDQAQVWLNGVQIYEVLQIRPAIHDHDAVIARLKSGWNSMLFRVANGENDHALIFRLSNSKRDIERAEQWKQ